MNPLSYLSAIAAVVYLYCAIRMIRLDPKASANRVGASLNLVLALWAFEAIFAYGLDDPVAVKRLYLLFSFCWNSFAALALHFCIRAAGHQPSAKRLFRMLTYVLLYGPAVLFTAATNVHMLERFEFRGGYWMPIMRSDGWLLAFTLYYLGYCLIGVAALVRARLMATGAMERRRLSIIVGSMVAALALGFISDTVFMVAGLDFPNMGILWIIIWEISVLSAMNRYSLLSPFPIREAARIVDAMADVFLYFDESGAVVWGNESAVLASGAGRLANLRGRRFDTLLAANEGDMANFYQVVNGETDSAFALVRFGKSQTPLASRVIAVRDKRGPGGSILAGRDLTDARRREHAEVLLEETGLLLDNFVSHSMDGIFVADKAGAIVRWNAAMETITGIAEADAKGRLVWEILGRVAVDHRTRDAAEEYLRRNFSSRGAESGAERSGRHYELNFRGRHGRARIMQVTGFEIPLPSGNTYAGIARDVTEERRAAEENIERIKRLDHAQKMDAIGTLTGGLAHDFNNALGGVVGSVSLVRMNIADGTYSAPADVLPEIEIIEQAASRATNSVRRLLSLTRKRTESFERVRLDDVARRVSEVAKRTIDPSVDVILGEPVPEAWIMGDVSQIEQLLLNLLINAGHAMTIMRKDDGKRGGIAAVGVEAFEPDSDFLAVHPTAGDRAYWALRVKDEGVGIPPELRSKIFDPFFTTKPPDKSTGLGLSMVHSIAKQHGGFVELESELGIGTEFIVYFPAVEADSGEAAARTEPVAKGEGLVLVADDEDVLRASMKSMLKALGYGSLEVADGAAAVEAFRADPAKFSAAVLDVSMPGLPGTEVLDALRATRPDIGVVLASGYADDAALAKLAADGAAIFLSKPFTVAELGSAVARSMRAAREKRPADADR